MSRHLETSTLEQYARELSVNWMLGHQVGRPDRDRPWLKDELHKLTFKDEFDIVTTGVLDRLVGSDKASFEAAYQDLLTNAPRDDAVFRQVLADNLAIDPDGNHVAGAIGTVVVGHRHLGQHVIDLRDGSKRIANHRWVVYAGEEIERAANSGIADPLPTPEVMMALNTRLSNVLAIALADQIDTTLAEGTSGPVLKGYSGAQPADPDTVASGTLLFTLAYSDPGFGAAADANPGGIITASTITDDTSADATATLGYCRLSSSNDSAAALDDHVDGEAGTSGADFNFNTVAIVSGATVSLTAHTITVPES